MGAFKKLALLAEENNRESMLLLADISRITNPHLSLFLYTKLKKEKEALEVKTYITNKDLYEDEDIFK